MSELLNALKRNLVNLSGFEAAVTQARIDAIENPQPDIAEEPDIADDPDSSFDGPDPYPPHTPHTATTFDEEE